MDTSNKVVAFAAKAAGDTPLNSAQTSALRKQLKERAAEFLTTAFQNMFNNLDDFLFDMADKSDTSAQQSSYFDAMRHVRLQKDSMRDVFVAKFTNAYNDAIKGNDKHPALNMFSEGALDNLLLVNDDELEESLAVSNMVSKARSVNKEQIFALEQRYKALLPNVAISAEKLPVGPQVICDAFKGAVKKLDIELKVKLIVYKLFDRYLIQDLGNCYYELNRLFAEAGVLPTIRVRAPVTAPSTARPRGTASPEAPVASPTPAAGPGASAPAAARSAQPEVFGTLQHLLMMQRRMTSHAGNDVGGTDQVGAPQGPATAYDTPTVLNALSALQHLPNEALSELKGKEEIAAYLKNTIVGHLAATNPKAAKKINQADTDTIDIVTMLFDFILDDKSLPDAFKALIARLQIPVLKVAIIDKTFFSKKSHPARRLLNDLARAGIGWSEISDCYNDPLYKKVAYVVNRVLNDFNNDVKLFTTLCDEFSAFLEEEKNQRRIEAERLESSKEIVAHEIETRIADVELPYSIRSFLSTAWKDVLTLIHTRDGNGGAAWSTALQVADDLVWSVQPKLTAKQKQRLVQTIPKMLNGLQDGLTLISYHRKEKDRLFRELESLHIASLKGDQGRAPTTAAPGQTAPATTAPKSKNDLDNLIDDLTSIPLVEDIILEEPTDTPLEVAPGYDEYTDRVAQLKVGVWVQFLEENGKAFRAKLAWKSEVLGEYTFVDRMYKVVADKTLQELAADFRDMRATVVEDVALLDRALDAVVNGLKRYVYSGDGKVVVTEPGAKI